MKNKLLAFSLVEVTLALGIVSFGLVSVLGLLPTGVNMAKESSDETGAVNILVAMDADVKGELEGADKESKRFKIPVLEVRSGKSFFDGEGRYLGNQGPYAEAVYVANWDIRARNSNSGVPPTVLLTVAWPAQAPKPSGFVETLVVLPKNPS